MDHVIQLYRVAPTYFEKLIKICYQKFRFFICTHIFLFRMLSHAVEASVRPSVCHTLRFYQNDTS